MVDALGQGGVCWDSYSCWPACLINHKHHHGVWFALWEHLGIFSTHALLLIFATFGMGAFHGILFGSIDDHISILYHLSSFQKAAATPWKVSQQVQVLPPKWHLGKDKTATWDASEGTFGGVPWASGSVSGAEILSEPSWHLPLRSPPEPDFYLRFHTPWYRDKDANL